MVCEPEPSAATCTNRQEIFIKGTEPESTVPPVVPPTPTSAPDQQQPAQQGPRGTPVPTPALPVAGRETPSGNGPGSVETAVPSSPGAADDAAGASQGLATAVSSSAAGQARATLPVVIMTPRHGSVVALPLVVTGAARPGTLVHLTVVSKSGPVRVETEDTYILADNSGTFTYEINPWLRPVGGTLVITAAAAVAADGEPAAGAATVSVHIR
jgi:hypothetical protein